MYIMYAKKVKQMYIETSRYLLIFIAEIVNTNEFQYLSK